MQFAPPFLAEKNDKEALQLTPDVSTKMSKGSANDKVDLPQQNCQVLPSFKGKDMCHGKSLPDFFGCEVSQEIVGCTPTNVPLWEIST